jgi:hypothetical protein
VTVSEVFYFTPKLSDLCVRCGNRLQAGENGPNLINELTTASLTRYSRKRAAKLIQLPTTGLFSGDEKFLALCKVFKFLGVIIRPARFLAGNVRLPRVGGLGILGANLSKDALASPANLRQFGIDLVKLLAYRSVFRAGVYIFHDGLLLVFENGFYVISFRIQAIGVAAARTC